MANVGSHRKIKQNVVYNIQYIEVRFFLLTWIYFLSPLFFWFYFLSSVSQISKISSLRMIYEASETGLSHPFLVEEV